MTMTRQEAEGTLARDYPPSECPALTAQRNAWAQTRPLAGLTVLDATPLFRNTLVKHLALQAAGAEVWVGYGRAMPFDPMAAEMAPALGLNIPDAARLAQGFDVVVDCAAAFADIPARLGYAELTRSGVAGYCAVAKTKPVFNVDGSRIKTFETALGTGDGGVQADRSVGFGNVWCSEMCPPYGHMDGVGLNQAHVAIQARAGIPTGRLRAVLQPYSQRVCPSVFMNIGSDIKVE